MRQYKPKVFFIGFNKNATVSFHNLFVDNGYISYHNLVDDTKQPTSENNLAEIMKHNVESGLPILTGMSGADSYSDLYANNNGIIVEGIDYFKEIYKEYPNSYFVLQTRDINDWLISRLGHREKKQYFAHRAMEALGLSESELIEYWRNARIEHYKKVYEFFNGSGNFLVYDIDTDSIDKLVNFLKDDFELDINHWQQHNKTPDKRKSKIKKYYEQRR